MQKRNNRQTFYVFADRWLQNTKLHVKESSYVKYVNLLQNHILPELGPIRMCNMTTEVVEAFIKNRLTMGKMSGNGGLSEKTVKDMIMVVKEIHYFAACQNVQMPCQFELIKMRPSSAEVTVLKVREQRALEELLLRDDSLTSTGVLLSLYMGLRLGEVCALTRKHIIYSQRLLQVRGTMQRIQNIGEDGAKKTKVIVTEPKSVSSVRDIPIPHFLFQRLECLRELPEDVFLLTGSNKKFIEPRSMENIFRRMLKECEIEHTNYHTLRHTFATRCIENGFDVKTLSEILGHANVNITLNRYVHSSMDQKRHNMEKVGRILR